MLLIARQKIKLLAPLCKKKLYIQMTLCLLCNFCLMIHRFHYFQVFLEVLLALLGLLSLLSLLGLWIHCIRRLQENLLALVVLEGLFLLLLRNIPLVLLGRLCRLLLLGL